MVLDVVGTGNPGVGQNLHATAPPTGERRSLCRATTGLSKLLAAGHRIGMARVAPTTHEGGRAR